MTRQKSVKSFGALSIRNENRRINSSRKWSWSLRRAGGGFAVCAAVQCVVGEVCEGKRGKVWFDALSGKAVIEEKLTKKYFEFLSETSAYRGFEPRTSQSQISSPFIHFILIPLYLLCLTFNQTPIKSLASRKTRNSSRAFADSPHLVSPSHFIDWFLSITNSWWFLKCRHSRGERLRRPLDGKWKCEQFVVSLLLLSGGVLIDEWMDFEMC
jgi:hypothetical protein